MHDVDQYVQFGLKGQRFVSAGHEVVQFFALDVLHEEGVAAFELWGDAEVFGDEVRAASFELRDYVFFVLEFVFELLLHFRFEFLQCDDLFLFVFVFEVAGAVGGVDVGDVCLGDEELAGAALAERFGHCFL